MAISANGAREFLADDWPWVQEWFQDPLLNRELGPMDQEWLEAIIAEDNGVQLVVSTGGEPVALLGCVWVRIYYIPLTISLI